MLRRSLIQFLHRHWVTIATALMLAGCTVVPAPVSYSYQPAACPPGVVASNCYVAVPNYAAPAYYYEPPFPDYPPYGPVYGGVWFGPGWHHRHW